METFYFIAILIVFAIGASALVLHGGLKDESRNKFRLVLHCIMIITSVIPPELPMELSLAVTNSLAGLSHLLDFCTEPFRSPLAGKLNVLCFDKTGTLTMNKMVLQDHTPTYAAGETRESLLRYAAMAAKWKEPARDALDTLVLNAVDKPSLDIIEQIEFMPFDGNKWDFSNKNSFAEIMDRVTKFLNKI
jgi:magnesium-transporting ATPase (P-type)